MQCVSVKIWGNVRTQGIRSHVREDTGFANDCMNLLDSSYGFTLGTDKLLSSYRPANVPQEQLRASMAQSTKAY
jgi:hypothetical protein